MSNRYNFLYFEAEFKKYLIAGNAGASTIKNYLSDLHFFFSWLKNENGISDLDCSSMPELFTVTLIRSFYHSITSSANSQNTSTRRLATLRKFFSFCIAQRWLRSNPAVEHLANKKEDVREEVVNSYSLFLKSTHGETPDIDRHIKVIRDLVINSSIL